MTDVERIRLVILGGAGVGKSCIIKRFLYKTYSDKYRATVEDLYNREYDLGSVTLKVSGRRRKTVVILINGLSTAGGHTRHVRRPAISGHATTVDCNGPCVPPGLRDHVRAQLRQCPAVLRRDSGTEGRFQGKSPAATFRNSCAPHTESN